MSDSSTSIVKIGGGVFHVPSSPLPHLPIEPAQSFQIECSANTFKTKSSIKLTLSGPAVTAFFIRTQKKEPSHYYTPILIKKQLFIPHTQGNRIMSERM